MKIRFERKNPNLYCYVFSLSILSWSKFKKYFQGLRYLEVRGEVMFLFGTGFKDLDLAKYTNEKERLPLSYMKLIYRLVINIFGYGYVVNQFMFCA
jgi:hypothetical protein